MDYQKVNVLFIVPSLRIGGAERQVIDLVNGISRDRFNVHLFTFEKQLDLIEGLSHEKTAFHNYPRHYKYDISPVMKIAQLIDREKIDIVHCTLQIALLFGLLGKLRARRKVRFVGAIHTTINRDLKGDLFDWFLYAPLMLFCDRVITVCHNQRIHWSRKYPLLAKKFTTIHNGIDTDKFKDTFSIEEKKQLKKSLGIQEDEYIAAIVASLRPEKGHEYAFKALKALTDSRRKVKLLLIGDGERKKYLKRLSRELYISEYLIWQGYQRDPRHFLSIADVLLVPSVAESFPMAILEALSMGKPVIASRVGGNSEVIREGVNGFLFKPKDIHSLAEKLQVLIEDDGLRGELTRKARESVSLKYGLSEMVRKTEELFAKLLD